ncbi:MAG TPA: hypothetical protein VFS41_09945, partial [Edaphobacter sp.]|nr:hypothetical protein [Edaphobacter sp.]
RLAYNLGDYKTALSLLERAADRHPENQENDAVLRQTRRILQLMPNDGLPAHERVDRILADRDIAKARWNACAQQAAVPQDQRQPLAVRWTSPDATSSRTALLRDSDKQTATLRLIYDTEIQTSQYCGAPTGDDALLLRLAQAYATKGGSH